MLTSAKAPLAGNNAVAARAYADPTQTKSSPLRSSIIVGSAVDTASYKHHVVTELELPCIARNRTYEFERGQKEGDFRRLPTRRSRQTRTALQAAL